MSSLNRLEGRALTVAITVTAGAGFTLFGWDQGVFGGVLSDQNFLNTFNSPSPTVQGQIVSSYDLGCMFGAVLSIFVGDRLGRRRTVLLGCLLVLIGGILQATSFQLAHLIVGRVVTGFGNGLNTATIPMWQSETCKPGSRGRLITLQMVMVMFGIEMSNWTNFGMTYLPGTSVSWRFPIAFQCFLAMLPMVLIVLTVESPRWLCYVDRYQEAAEVISRLEAKQVDDPAVTDQIRIMKSTIEEQKVHFPTRSDTVGALQTSWNEIFASGEKQNLRRLLLGAGVSLMQQFGGTNVIVYYMPIIFVQSFGFSQRMALILTAIDSLSVCFWGIILSMIVDKVGRKKLMFWGALGQGLSFTAACAGLGVGSKAANGVAVAFIFLFHACWGLSFLSLPFIYPSEINSQKMRNLGNSFAMIVQWLCVYIVVLITPTAIANIKWRFYIIFAVFNLSWLIFIWLFYVETAGLSLEEIDHMFKIKYHGGKTMSWKDARCAAQEEVLRTSGIVHPGQKDDMIKTDISEIEYKS